MADQNLYYAKLTYNANGTGVSGVPGASTYGTSTSGGSVTGYVSTSRPTRTYFTFNGWALSSSASSGMSGGAALSLTAATSKGTGNARNYNLYATWAHVNVTCTFNANGGTGAPSPVTHWGGYAMDIPDTIPTRSGYTFLGWAKESTATSALYTAGQKEVALYGNITLYAVWTPANSAIASVTSSVPMDGSTQGTLTITRYNSSYVHSVTIALSSSLKQEFTNVGTSLSFTLPASWIAGVPNATSATVTVTVKTMNGSTQVGNAATATFTATVPASIVPSISSVTESFVNDNTTVNSWGILLQGYSKIRLTASATAGSGASIASYEFSGLGLSYTGTSNAATSNVLSDSGSKTWTVRVTDSRGRTATQTVTFTVYEYVTPSISSFAAERSDSTGQRDDVNGDYLHSKMVYAFSSANGNNSVTAEISYKAHNASSWTVGQSAVVSDTWYTFGGGNIDIDKNFDVRATLTDALGQTVTYIVEVQSVVGYSFGLKNDRVRFGGVVQKPGFQNDLDLEQNGILDVTNRRCYESLSSAGWYRVMTYAGVSTAALRGGQGIEIRLNIQRVGENHSITFRSVGENLVYWTDETSKSSTMLVDKIRWIYSTSASEAYIDIHYTYSQSCMVGIDFEVHGVSINEQKRVTSSNLVAVADAPSGETVLTTYNLFANTDRELYVSNNYVKAHFYAVGNVKTVVLNDFKNIPTGVITTVISPSEMAEFIPTIPLGYDFVAMSSASEHVRLYIDNLGVRAYNYSNNTSVINSFQTVTYV